MKRLKQVVQLPQKWSLDITGSRLFFLMKAVLQHACAEILETEELLVVYKVLTINGWTYQIVVHITIIIYINLG